MDSLKYALSRTKMMHDTIDFSADATSFSTETQYQGTTENVALKRII